MSEKDDAPIFDLAVFGRDLYQLASMLMSAVRLRDDAELRELLKDHFRKELNRLLLIVAVSARQMLDILKARSKQDKSADVECGNYTIKDREGALRFRQACNSIIHAKAVPQYKFQYKYEKGDSELKVAAQRAASELVIVINSSVHIGKKNVEAVLDLKGIEFVKCCKMVSSKVGA